MSPMSPADWPDEPGGLVRLAADQMQSLEVRQRAFQGLIPVIHRVARRLALRFLGGHGRIGWTSIGYFMACLRPAVFRRPSCIPATRSLSVTPSWPGCSM